MVVIYFISLLFRPDRILACDQVHLTNYVVTFYDHGAQNTNQYLIDQFDIDSVCRSIEKRIEFLHFDQINCA